MLQPSPKCIFSICKEGQKEALKYFKNVTKIFPNGGHIFHNKLRNTWTVIMKICFYGYKFEHLVCRAKDKNIIKNV